jgi:hypothetical protein
MKLITIYEIRWQYYRAYKSLLLDPTLSHINPIYFLITCLRFTIIPFSKVFCSVQYRFCGSVFWEVVGQTQGLLSLVSTIWKLLGRKNIGFGLRNRNYGRRIPPRWPHAAPLALTTPTSNCRSVGIVRLRTKATEFIISPKLFPSAWNCLFQARCISCPIIIYVAPLILKRHWN